MKDLDSSLVHSSWLPVLEPLREDINNIFRQLDAKTVSPREDQILRAFQEPLSSIRCVIIGQDPYPTAGHANGFAFSTDASVRPLPKSLQNIFAEFETDLKRPSPRTGDLSPWVSQGVMLLNRVLTTEIGVANAHAELGWQKISDAVARELGARDVVAILWGKQAQELAELFSFRVESPHPSPLSSYRGFFGSKPFSKVNALLAELGRDEIDW
jgi:uracil-DNA glycosylase